MTFREVVEGVGTVVDGVGVATLVGGIVIATASMLRAPQLSGEERYRVYRQRVGKAILLGLELLVAADIIRTVAVRPTLESAAVLAIIVVIRTALSFTLEVELEGRWPWERSRAEVPAPVRNGGDGGEGGDGGAGGDGPRGPAPR